MSRGRRSTFLSFAILRRLTLGILGIGVPCVLGCSQFRPTSGLNLQRPMVVKVDVAQPIVLRKPAPISAMPPASPPRRELQTVRHEEPRPAVKPGTPATLPEPSTNFAREKVEAMPAKSEQVLPVSLDTVFRLAEEQNVLIALARARVREACAEKAVAAKAWLPAVYVGTAYYRHEGGIQNEDGRLLHSSYGALFGGLELNAKFDPRDVAYQQINAARKVWQQKGELTKINYETLLDASGTYIDLLAARTGELLIQSSLKNLKELDDRAQKLAKNEPAAKVEVARIQTDMHGRQQILARLRGEVRAASAKLAYLLGVDARTNLVPVDERLSPLDLVDVSQPVDHMVAQALAAGPGVREMEGMLALILESMEKAKGPGQYLPVVQLRMLQGGFGAGPGSELDWENRWDMGVQFRWNLTDCLTKRDRQRVAQARLDQLHFANQDLRGKLTLGVQEARDSILSTREQIRFAQQQIQEAEQAYKLSKEQLLNNIPGVTPSIVQMSVQVVSLAQGNLVQAVRAHNRAQLRLLLLLGESGSPSAGR